MKGDFSRWRVDQDKNFNGVLHQQGRVLTDNDWNDDTRFLNHWQQQAGSDTIGPSVAAVPVENPDGFNVVSAQLKPGSDNLEVEIQVQPGRVWVDGLLTYLPFDEEKLLKTVTRSATYLPPPIGNIADNTGSIAKGKRDAIILEVWQESINGFQVPDQLLEHALGGPDTTERVLTSTAFRLLPLHEGETCLDIPAKLRENPNKKGKLIATLEESETISSDCPVQEKGGYTGFEHHLNRIEIALLDQNILDVNGPMFKWSRFNGGLVGGGEFIKNNGMTPDKVKIIHNLQAIATSGGTGSFYLEAIKYNKAHGHWQVIYGVTAHLNDDNELELTGPVHYGSIPNNKDIVFFRLWDKIERISTYSEPLASGGAKHFEEGIHLLIDADTGTNYLPGDYWTFEVRAGEIENPLTLIGKEFGSAVNGEPPHGIQYHRVVLGIVEWGKNNIPIKNQHTEIDDCRIIFPNLTHIKASDVSYQDNYCNMDSTGQLTVQDAIDFLCRRTHSCTLVAVPGKNWEKIFNLIEDNKSAQVCFQVGTYYLDKTVLLKNKKNIKFRGAGNGTRIIVKKSEEAFVFENCEQVTIRDLYVESQVSGFRRDHEHLHGTLTFLRCDEVNLEKVDLKNAADSRRASTCITVRNTATDIKKARINAFVNIQNCNLSVGHLQTGMLLVNTNKAFIENNNISVGKKTSKLTLLELSKDKYYNGLIRNLLISKITFDKETPERKKNIVVTKISGHSVYFKTEEKLKSIWLNALKMKLIRTDRLDSAREVKRVLFEFADKIIENKGVVFEFGDFRNWYKGLSTNIPAVAGQGIVVAGQVVRELHVLNNTIRGVMQGVRLGVSHREPFKGRIDQADTTLINGNNISISLPSILDKERFGIFVGNCKSIVIQNNHLKAVYLIPRLRAKAYVEGIRIYGHLGKRMIISQNHTERFIRGIYVKPLNAASIPSPLWFVKENVATVYATSSKVKKSENFA
jgi:Family of unknown function (DUF6519)